MITSCHHIISKFKLVRCVKSPCTIHFVFAMGNVVFHICNGGLIAYLYYTSIRYYQIIVIDSRVGGTMEASWWAELGFVKPAHLYLLNLMPIMLGFLLSTFYFLNVSFLLILSFYFSSPILLSFLLIILSLLFRSTLNHITLLLLCLYFMYTCLPSYNNKTFKPFKTLTYKYRSLQYKSQKNVN